jgi:hypothetical protein
LLQGVTIFFLDHTWYPRWLTRYLIGSIFEL